MDGDLLLFHQKVKLIFVDECGTYFKLCKLWRTDVMPVL